MIYIRGRVFCDRYPPPSHTEAPEWMISLSDLLPYMWMEIEDSEEFDFFFPFTG